MLIGQLIQVLGIVAIAVWAVAASAGRSPLIVRCARLTGRCARKPFIAMALCATVAAIAVIVPCCLRPPVPAIHDEFSYLLAGDTFAHGRLANPVHPMWRHFESFHILQQPSYASKYQPLQGFFLALGSLIDGRPIVGVWIATSLAAVSSCWMLRGFAPPRWALLGGLIVAVHPTIASVWGYGYWGGAAPMTGGALVLGAAARLTKRPRVRDTLALISGVAMLANGRPFEGLIVSLVVGGWLLAAIIRQRTTNLRAWLQQFVLPGSVGLALMAGGMAYYNQCVTGDWFRLPYQVHEAQYNISPIFVWQQPRPEPEYRHRVMREFYVQNTREWHHAQQTFAGFASQRARMWLHSWSFLLGLALSIPLASAACVFRRRSVRIAGSIVAAVLLATLGVTWFLPHYLSPIMPAFILLIIEGLRVLHAWRSRGRHIGHRLAVGVVLVFFGFATLRYATHVASAASSQVDSRSPTAWAWQRDKITAGLLATPGSHLVVVRYANDHDPNQEWVYNAADIDASRIVWAREMSGRENGELLEYFAERTPWLLEADTRPPRLLKIPR
ncbi:MAG: hypothetical protein KDA42_02565 [Planctomycetales bacterium]|nr:hypothetical protein [Planctomycetales bacterium]